MSETNLKIEDIKVGEGEAVSSGDWISVDYTGTLTDGTIFDSSKGRGPFKFRIGVGQVIDGWEMGILGMKIGGVRKLTIPPQLAYGERAIGSIPANSTLVFEVTLVGIGA
jgi:FKBP-type peptidyl-prolyl cis-trans isomerase